IKHGYSRFYIQGIVRQEYKKVKELLKPLGFQLNKIANLNFIGKKTLEFTINSDYASAFVRKVNELKVLKLIPKVDPSVPLDFSASEDSKQVVKTAFTNQLRRSYLSTSNKKYAGYLRDLALESGVDLGDRAPFPEDLETSSQDSGDSVATEILSPSSDDDDFEVDMSPDISPPCSPRQNIS
ncbi:hypothetical protein BB560_005641, partial [Smittium megazygosporum]